MESEQTDSSSSPIVGAPDVQHSVTQEHACTQETSSIFSASGISSWARRLKNPQQSVKEEPSSGNAVMTSFARLAGGIGTRLSSKIPVQDGIADGNSTTVQPGVLGSLTKGLMDSSLSAVKAVQVKARHVVSQNKRRYQEDGFDLDMTYITNNILGMGFPAGDMSSGFLGYVEGFYRNHMEEVIRFFETHHKGKYKVYNLCSERLYNAALFEGKVASFPFDDNNCPSIELIPLFCQSASSWLKEDNENVVAVHCKAGLARTGLMISSLLLFLKLFPTAEEAIDYYNHKRCLDGKGLVLPSQIRYVKYFEHILMNFNGEVQAGRRCLLRGFRLHKCPYWIRPSITISNHQGVLFSTKRHPKTKDLMPEDFWFSSKNKGIMIFALPGEPGLTELAGDFKIYFHDRQGDFYCWLNTTMMENRIILPASELDDFEKRKIPAPGFQVEIVMVDYDGSYPQGPTSDNKKSDGSCVNAAATRDSSMPSDNPAKDRGSHDKDDIFSDSESDESSKGRQTKIVSNVKGPPATEESENKDSQGTSITGHSVDEQVFLRSEGVSELHDTKELKKDGQIGSSSVLKESNLSSGESEFKPIAADASVFSFGDEDEYESE